MKKSVQCVRCEHRYRGMSGNLDCLVGADPDTCQNFEPQKICCFDCNMYDVADKRCLLNKAVPGAFKRHSCGDFERERVK